MGSIFGLGAMLLLPTLWLTVRICFPADQRISHQLFDVHSAVFWLCRVQFGFVAMSPRAAPIYFILFELVVAAAFCGSGVVGELIPLQAGLVCS